MAWVLLVLAGVLEIGWTLGLKFSDGFSKFWPSVATILAMILSMGLLGISVRTLPIGTAYAVWTGIGAVGAATFGILWFHEPATAARIVCLLLIMVGIIGLKLATPTPE